MTPEEQLHITVADYLKTCCPKLVWCHVPNGGQRNAIVGAKLKRMGCLAGWPDLQFVRDGKLHCIELKRPDKKPRLSASQEAVREALEHEGVPYAVCNSLEAVQGALKAWRLNG